MKKLLVILMVVLLGITLFGKVKVALLINGTLGDKSFFDSAARGVKWAEEKLGVEAKIIEMSYNPTEWEPTLEDISDLGEYDLIIVGTWQMVELLQRIAPMYPDQKYIIYDDAVDYSQGNLDNVYSITYKQNEGSFLAGAMAAMVSKSDKFKYSLPDKKIIGFLGGMDIPVINDFLVGYIEGAKYIDPDMKVLISYVGVWNDPAKGKEFTLSMYRQGADVVFAVAGETGNGVLAAAKDMDRWAIGVDSDMQLLYEEKDMDIVKHTITSMLKNVDYSLYKSIEMFIEGKLPFGKAEAWGLKEKGVGLADNKYFQQVMSVDPWILIKLKDIELGIIRGDIKVPTAYGMSNEELNKIRNSVRP
ncbi:adenine nucleotide translocator 1 [Marinitoga sp. 1135]|uniref:Putative ABC-type transport system, periplasmic component/surface lipoprotein n=1 Tax=Marinitoga piezophila (strain DSM 14283 / JCM 11233 / KA3) TaxID=443254 RepID=H2J450_MARPK|nr:MULTISPECIES: BMP family ABC transporter substrate-binding protein [Marinitoga]AEX85865.1 putative ABC-type transport system, periplasmic component/surface lipoprotein [Marinitoga piezophila KA3]APT76301.1 adenine nucleotide translocator 1 [Marinitoga sp. 1137]NUU96067.1 adenine nucleotide translocator 1 [Marinitoga sp. 1135]NUU97978.1 adenine nucleotide translocator 1 [Marinitoga sp. 1138]